MVQRKNKKSASAKRFQQVNHIVDRVIRHLNPSHALILLIGWRHANPEGEFQLSGTRFAEQSGISKRHVTNIIDKLIEVGALEVLQEAVGTRSTLYKITGTPQSENQIRS